MPITPDDIVDAWATAGGGGAVLFDERLAEADGSFADLCNAVALRVAERLLSGALSFSAADAAANALWSRIVDELHDQPLPEPAYSIFNAIDAGEYSHAGDDPGADPVQMYTIPTLRQLVRPE